MHTCTYRQRPAPFHRWPNLLTQTTAHLQVFVMNASVPSLKTISAPGGAFIGIDFDTNQLRVVTPVDTAARVAGLTYIYDIFPWRAPRTIPAGSTFPFVLSGANFNKLGMPLAPCFRW